MRKRPEIAPVRGARCRRCALGVAADAEVCPSCGAGKPTARSPSAPEWLLLLGCLTLSAFLPVLAWLGGG